jgi:hypothetical protein
MSLYESVRICHEKSWKFFFKFFSSFFALFTAVLIYQLYVGGQTKQMAVGVLIFGIISLIARWNYSEIKINFWLLNALVVLSSGVLFLFGFYGIAGTLAIGLVIISLMVLFTKGKKGFVLKAVVP